MALGDSITAGYTNNSTGANSWSIDFEFGYRGGLYSRLTNAGYDFKFVGESQEPYNGAFGDPSRGGTYTPALDLRAPEIDQDGHRGYGARNTAFIRDGIRDGINDGIDDGITANGWLAKDDPDIVLIHLGTNGRDTAGLDGLIGDITTTKPNVKVVLAQIIPKQNNTAMQKQEWIDYNEYLKNTIAPKYANVTLVDQYTPFLVDVTDPLTFNSSLFATGNHPNNAGYDQMAQVWFEGIQAATAVPEPSAFVVAGLMLPWALRRRR